MKLYRRVLHATDFSRASAPAFRQALIAARRSRAELVLVHVIEPPAVVLEDAFATARIYREMQADTERRARRGLDRLRAQARRAGVRASALALTGIPWEEIVKAAARTRADLVVVGTHGRTGLPRFVIGSVAERVVSRSRCPVLTVPTTR